MSKYIFVDFEYNKSNEPNPDLVCASWMTSDEGVIRNAWLYHNVGGQRVLFHQLTDYIRQGYIFVVYAATAESRCFEALGIDPTTCKWVDLYLEFRQIRNCYDKYNYGTYYLKNFKRKSVPPKMNKTLNYGKDNKILNFGLADCCARLLNINVDKDLKRAMRDLILSAPTEDYTPDEKKDIMEYCDSDIVHLPKIHKIMTDIIADKLDQKHEVVEANQLKRGEFSALVAGMESRGLPLDMKAITHLRQNVDLAKETLISSLVENYYPFFMRRKKGGDLRGRWVDTYSQFYKFVKEHEELDLKMWKLTDSGRLCTDDEYLKNYEGIPEIKEYREVKKILGQLKWLRVPKEGDLDLFDSIGSDGCIRTFFGIYGTQTGRNAPKARQFIFAMSAWLRCLIRPPKGYTITEIDYASQEFGIAGILSKDKGMLEAYESGDPYLYFAKKAKAVPKDGTKAEYKKERDLFKATTLGLQYGMGARSLSVKLSGDTGRFVSVDEAEDLIDLHKKVYPKYWRWLKTIDKKYAQYGHLKLPCGWVMFGDNKSVLSVRNLPTQGAGSSIIREAVKQCAHVGINVVSTLHDSIYIISKDEDLESDILHAKSIMIESFNDILDQNKLEIRLDVMSHGSNEPWISEKGERFYHILKDYLEYQENEQEREEKTLATIFS